MKKLLNINKYFVSQALLIQVFIVAMLFLIGNLKAQDKALVNTSNSPYAKLHSINMADVTWTKGFWADRFKVKTETMVPK